MTTFTKHQLEALNTNAHISLTANAGSGKTFVLKERFLKIVLELGVPLREIVAITFTKKAASELYKKIAELIDSRINDIKYKNERGKLEEIRRQLISANISTIDSFCVNILKEFPVEAGIDANFSPIDETLTTELLELSVEETIKRHFIRPDLEKSLKELIRVFGSVSIVKKQITGLVRNRKTLLDLIDILYSKNEGELTSHFRNTFLQLRDRILQPDFNQFINSFIKINETAITEKSEIAFNLKKTLKKLIDAKDIIIFFDNIEELQSIFTKSGDIKKIGYLRRNREGFESELTIVSNFFKVAEELNITPDDLQHEKELARLSKSIIQIFKDVLEIYDRKKLSNAYLDFEDILIKTLDVLSNAEVKESLSKKFKYLMIDEYQDTNELQYKIFLPILNELMDGNLFVVGDDKQSIYQFRNAELEVFRKTNEKISSFGEGGKILTLPESFRMAPQICAFTNFVFEHLFTNPNPLFNEVHSNPIICAKKDELDSKIEFLLAGEENQSTPEKEGDLVAKRILYLIKEEKSVEVNFKDIAILCRKRKSFKLLEASLKKYKVPYTIVGGTGFYQQQLIYDIYNYLLFLINPLDDTALVAILRSPFFFLSDTEILSISLQHGKSFWDKLQILGKTNHRISVIIQLLNENKSLANSTDIVFLLRKILRDDGYLAVYASTKDYKQVLDNFEKLIRITSDFFKQGFRNLYDYLLFLKESISHQENEGQATLIDNQDAVKIMTIHQSKGLEFKCVFMFGLHDYTVNSAIKSKSIYSDKTLGLLFKTPLNRDYFSSYEAAPITKVYNIINRKKSIAELKRLLYVSITRTKNYLFLSADLSKKSNSESFLSLLNLVFTEIRTSSDINFSTQLTYLETDKQSFKNRTDEIDVKIPIIKSLDEISFENEESFEQSSKIYNLFPYSALQSKEIISATKVSMFLQCPVKYRLTYEFGFSELQKKIWEQKELPLKYFEVIEEDIDSLESDEQITKIPKADLKGRVIHRVLQNNIPSSELIETLKLYLFEENIDENSVTNFSIKIASELELFYKSEVYTEINNYKNSINEYELYSKLSDFYLYGIIDQLIHDGEKVIVIDFKTDDFEESQLELKKQNYLPQLKFYALLLSLKQIKIKEIELKLVFIKQPHLSISYLMNLNDINTFGSEVTSIVNSIRNRTYKKNLSHCRECIFSSSHSKCILK
ncbi:MAG: UvrD-helicase domain-containing protein [Ignavibacteriaceae bacterium]|nr:UvrD-helicase domain-containing protein [Ignavibacteriaceae bacterium]